LSRFATAQERKRAPTPRAPIRHSLILQSAMKLVPGSERIVALQATNPIDGVVHWAPQKSLWVSAMTLGALIGAPMFFSWSGLAVFFATTALTLCLGHSLGMHRRLIHSAFEMPRWLEYVCVYLGTIVGMAGPIGMTRLHDFRDWAQRQRDCHAYFCHRSSFWRDAWWQLHCELKLTHPPRFAPEARLAVDRFYAFLERFWMWQQLPWAVLFYTTGGASWLFWGICARVAISVTGHWFIGYYAHREGGQTWVVRGAAAQGYNISWAGLISMGESWHNNHHAFPGSAKLGLFRGQFDPGWWVICLWERCGLVWNIKQPDDLAYRPELLRLPTNQRGVTAHA
jgi:stearoyl-CoA desaturase (delta-9 desaturase)